MLVLMSILADFVQDALMDPIRSIGQTMDALFRQLHVSSATATLRKH